MGQVIIVNCNNIPVENMDLSNTSVGIELWRTENSKVLNNTVGNNRGGIILYFSSNNRITGNNASNNNWDGIRLYDSNNNTIFFNNFINNTDIVFSYESTINIWNSTEKITYIYNGTTYKSYLGNYWRDYEGTDADRDGIGNTPYSIDSVSDEYPLMKPFENYIIPTSAPA